MLKYVAAAALSLVAIQPASAATIFDYNVYVGGDAYISGGSYGDVAAGSFRNANGSGGTNVSSVSSSSAALNTEAANLSAQLRGMSPKGTVTSGQWTPNDVTLTGTTDGVNVFNIDGSRWSQLYALTFAGPGSGAIVNVSGSSLAGSLRPNFAGLSSDKVIFNFYEAKNVKWDGAQLGGSILAPDAFVRLQGGTVSGSVVSGSFHSEGTQIGGGGFSGFAPISAVPEPATWALMIIGFGAVGMAMRRRSSRRLQLA